MTLYRNVQRNDQSYCFKMVLAAARKLLIVLIATFILYYCYYYISKKNNSDVERAKQILRNLKTGSGSASIERLLKKHKRRYERIKSEAARQNQSIIFTSVKTYHNWILQRKRNTKIHSLAVIGQNKEHEQTILKYSDISPNASYKIFSVKQVFIEKLGLKVSDSITLLFMLACVDELCYHDRSRLFICKEDKMK